MNDIRPDVREMSDPEPSGCGCGVSSNTCRTEPSLPGDFHRRILTLFGVVFGIVLFVVVAGEWLGLFDEVTKRVPAPVGLLLVLLGGYPVFREVLRAARRRQVTSHTLMTAGVVAAMAVGEWATAAVVVFFMRIGDYAERFTAFRARTAVRGLTAMAPQTARVERNGEENEIPVQEVRIGEIVVVRPGEKIPVDGDVVGGQAAVDHSAITGESLPLEAGPGTHVLAAGIARAGALRIQTVRVGEDSTFGRVIRMVEEAEAHRSEVQRIADRFSSWYLPVVSVVALLTWLLRRDPLSVAAVLVVACSCSFALATPIAMLASIGAAARRGLLIKGGRYLESLSRADVLLIDKTGTLTTGRLRISEIVPFDGASAGEVLALAASAERFSEHPLGEAVRNAARERKIAAEDPAEFLAVPGMGVRATIGGDSVSVGNRRMISLESSVPEADALESEGKTLLFVARNGRLTGMLAAEDTLRAEVPDALRMLRELGIRRIELLTGDNERTASSLGKRLGIDCRAGLLPEDKIAVVKEYQAQGRTVVMVGDGVNDAPALAQADVGIAMGTAGVDVAIEAAHIALMREDWRLVPALFRISRKTMTVVRFNIGFTAVYNLAGLALASMGILPPVLAAAAQSLPDLGILANSSRLLKGES